MKLASREVHFILYTGPPVCQAPPERIFFLVQKVGGEDTRPLRRSGCGKSPVPGGLFPQPCIPLLFRPARAEKSSLCSPPPLLCKGGGGYVSLEAGFRPLELPRLILNHLSLKKRDPQAGRRRGPVSSPPQFTCFQYFLPQLRTFWPNGRCPIKRLRPFHPAQRVSSPRDWIRRLRREMALCRFITMEAT